MKTAKGEIVIKDFIEVYCPHCDDLNSIEWGDTSDMSMPSPISFDGESVECEHCKMQFIIKLDK